MAPTPWRRLGAAALVGLLGTAGLATGASATAAFSLSRVAGTDRYSTAAAVSGNAFATGAQTVVLARGDQFADALAGGYLAGLQTGGAPVLLTTTGAVPDATRSRLTALGAKNVILLGGTSAISQAVQDDLAKSYTVTRVAGANRFDTAAKIAQTPSTLGVGTLGGQKTAIVANGESFADALAAGPVSFAQRYPIVLTRAGELPPESKAALTALGIKHVVVVGGASAVGSAVISDIQSTGATTEVVAGANRYATATALADWAQQKVAGWSTSAIDLATGESFADALAGGPAAGRSTRSILLTQTATLSNDTATWLQAHAATLTGGRVFGGTGAVTDATRSAAQQAGGAATSQTGGQLTEANTNANQYTYVPAGGTEAKTVTYKATDVFTVDGKPADIDGFEANATPADTVVYTAASGTTAAKHDLTNVVASTITSGLIGNINTLPGATSFAFINPVTGTAVRAGVKYTGTGATYTVDGTAADQAGFEADISEGDTLTITGAAFALKNGAVTGAAQLIDKSAQLLRVQFAAGPFGDDPGAPSNDLFAADGQDTFKVGGATSTYTAFATNLTTGDQVTYSRSKGDETYVLVDQAPATQTGQAVGTITADGDGLPANNGGDGGSFQLATATGNPTITYGPSGVFVVNGAVSSEANFESRYSPGDEITYRAADTPSGQAQRLELTDGNLAGPVKASTVNTADTPNGNTYDVLAKNGTTVLATVSYTAGNDLYALNGVSATLADFEAALNEIKAGTKTGSVVESTSGATNKLHSLTTATPTS